MDNIPFFAVGNGELDGNKKLKKDDLIDCPHCSQKHSVKLSKNEAGEEVSTIMYYNCGENSYLCGIGGKVIGV